MPLFIFIIGSVLVSALLWIVGIASTIPVSLASVLAVAVVIAGITTVLFMPLTKHRNNRM